MRTTVPSARPAGQRWRPKALALAAAFILSAVLPAAANGIVVGDSLGVGVSMASGLQRLARNSVAIRGGSVIGQIKQAPSGSTVFMSLGTNDAVGRIEGLEGDIKRIVAAAADVKLVWIGPPCVMKPWDVNAKKLDGIIRTTTAGSSVTYVSMRDDALCAPAQRARDGVHFTMAGYGMMWAKARDSIGFTGGTTRVASADPAKPRTARRARRRSVKVAQAKPAPAAEAGALTTTAAAPARPRRKRLNPTAAADQ